MTLDELFPPYRQSLLAAGLAESTLVIARYYLYTFLQPGEDITALTEARIVDCLAAQRQRGRSLWTLRKAYDVVSRFARWAAASRHLPADPTAAVTRPKQGRSLRRPATDDELAKLLAAAAVSRWAERDTAILLTLARTGVRRGELVRMDIAHLNLEQRWIYLPTTKNGEARHVRFDADTQTAIRRYLQTRAPGDHPALFLSQRGRGRMTASGVNLLFRRLRQATGVPVTPHMLRHYFATHWVNQGNGNDLALQVLLGHSDGRMTKYYAHHATAGLGRAYDLVHGQEPEPPPPTSRPEELLPDAEQAPGYDELYAAVLQLPNMLGLARLYQVPEHRMRYWVTRLGLLKLYDERRQAVMGMQAAHFEKVLEADDLAAAIAKTPNWEALARQFGVANATVRYWAKQHDMLPLYYAARKRMQRSQKSQAKESASGI